MYVALTCRIVLIAVFLIAVVTKIWGRQAFLDFRDAVHRMLPWTPTGAAGLTGWSVAVVLAEAMTVTLLAVPVSVTVGFAVAGGVLLVFTVGIARGIRSGTGGACRCFGAAPTPLSARHLVRNGLLLAVTALGLVTSTMPGSGWHAAGVVLSLVTAGVVASMIVVFDDVASLFVAPATPRSRQTVDRRSASSVRRDV
jgi:hypothetical protein